MRRRRYNYIILYILLLLTLSGCGGIHASRRGMEHLRPIQTISLDRAEDGVTLGVSSGPGPEGEAPLVMLDRGAGIEPAIRRLQSYSPSEELFFAHVRYILLGSSMAGDRILPLLDWAERSPSMRMDARLLLVWGSAGEVLTGSAAEDGDVTARLSCLEQQIKSRGLRARSLRDIAADLLERGAALCLVVGPLPAEPTLVSGGGADASAAAEGLAVLRSGQSPVFLDPAETMGAALLQGGVTGAGAVIDGCVLELSSPGAEAAGLWDRRGELTGIELRCELRAGLLERDEADTAEPADLEAALARTAEEWLTAAVARSQAMECDFTDLTDAVWKSAPRGARREDAAAAVFSVPVTVRVTAVLDRSYDLTD